MTRKVTFGLANSLDNRIARGDHSYDWLVWDDEVAKNEIAKAMARIKLAG